MGQTMNDGKHEKLGVIFSKKDEPLVSMRNRSPKIVIHPIYYQKNILGTSDDLFLREGVARKVISAANQLPEGLSLVLLDGWRSYETQLYIYKKTIYEFKKMGYTDEKIKRDIGSFVAYPSKDPEKPAPHFTGGAIDLTIAKDMEWLDMGTDFDDFSDKAYLDYYENCENLTEQDTVRRDNRRLLKAIMTQEGFTVNPSEWWHYDFGNRPWSEKTKQSMLYSGISKWPLE
ncbi:M15 family metallopeptidase [Terrilactibacillus laevilacticus]|uniref:D-alanyl-D-alanine dipeptidase n=1 Tax=Terrilactibacillus laevilacticus TaxID=1380157 RepID=A0ABW5PNB7_9BACI|nr:M15 family metallopeptidase [Terrilactibacillus laevilacticus]